MTSGPLVKSVRLSTILGGDTRLEASTYLRDGYGFVRLANQCKNHVRLGDLADIWQPSRLTGYTMPDGKGLPFFTAGQVFEDFPRVRKWLAAPFVPQADTRYVKQDWLLLSCSGVVGNITAVYPHHLDKIITHDLLRIVPKDANEYGWLYAYMKTNFFKQIAQAAQYGHMIKHIEVSHASEFPIIMPENDVRKTIGETARRAVLLRSKSWKMRDEAFSTLEKHVGACRDSATQSQTANQGEVSLAAILQNRLRLDADSFVGAIKDVDELINACDWDYLGNLTSDVVEPTRFKRFYGESDVPFVGISELFDVNAQPTKHVYPKLIKGYQQFMLEPGTLVMARSGQKYGILGRVLKINENHRGMMGSDHLTRIYPDEAKLRSGYLLAFLNDPLIGRPSVIRHAFGTSIPELAPTDIKRIRIPRLGDANEKSIADLMDESARMSAEADRLENEATRLAQEQIDLAIAQLSDDK